VPYEHPVGAESGLGQKGVGGGQDLGGGAGGLKPEWAPGTERSGTGLAAFGQIGRLADFGSETNCWLRQVTSYWEMATALVNHGILPDMCILCEPTARQLVLEHAGSLWVRLSTLVNYVHTAFAPGHEDQNSIRRMHQVLEAVMEWIPTWEEKAAWAGRKGFVNVGSIRGGHPWRASRTPERTDLFLDVRVPPTIAMTDARKYVKEFFLQLRRRYPEYELEFETYVSVPGATIGEEHEMVKAIESNHRIVMGKVPARDAVLWCSDASVLTRYGIETVNYGPSSGPRDHEGEKVRIQTLVDIAKIYALTAAQICGVA